MTTLATVRISARTPTLPAPASRVAMLVRTATEADPNPYVITQDPQSRGYRLALVELADVAHVLRASSRTSEVPRTIESYDHQFLEYLERLVSSSEPFSEEHIAHVRSLWRTLRLEFGAPPLPVVVPTPEHALQLSWQSEPAQISVDIFEAGRCEWFYLNHQTESYEGCETEQPSALPRNLERYLREILVG
jgi:hypothetical protein